MIAQARLDLMITTGRLKFLPPLDTTLTPVPAPSPGWVALRQQLASDATAGCPFARFIEASGLADDVPDRAVRRNGNPY